MTRRQQQAMAFIEAFISVRGYSPSYTEIQVELGFTSRSRIYDLVHALIAGGRITIRPGCARSIRLVAPAEARMREALETAPTPLVADTAYVDWYGGARVEALEA